MPDEAAEKSPANADPQPSSPPVDPASETRATDAPSVDTQSGDAAAPRRKRKKKKVAADVPEAPVEPALTADGRERPLFVLGFPRDPELDRLVRAFELGNYAYVREHAPTLAEKSSSESVRAAARELARRIEPDPLIKILLGLSVLLLIALAVWAYKTHGA